MMRLKGGVCGCSAMAVEIADTSGSVDVVSSGISALVSRQPDP